MVADPSHRCADPQAAGLILVKAGDVVGTQGPLVIGIVGNVHKAPRRPIVDLDATAERAEFADAPWLPAELKEVVDAVLGCTVFPENPEDLYRPPVAASTPSQAAAITHETGGRRSSRSRVVDGGDTFDPATMEPLGELSVVLARVR